MPLILVWHAASAQEVSAPELAIQQMTTTLAMTIAVTAAPMEDIPVVLVVQLFAQEGHATKLELVMTVDAIVEAATDQLEMVAIVQGEALVAVVAMEEPAEAPEVVAAQVKSREYPSAKMSTHVVAEVEALDAPAVDPRIHTSVTAHAQDDK